MGLEIEPLKAECILRFPKYGANLARPFLKYLGPTYRNCGLIRYNNKETFDKMWGILAQLYLKSGPSLEKVCKMAHSPTLEYALQR